MAGKSIILFDGECGLCARAVRFLGDRDSKGVFRFVPLRSDVARRLLEEYGPEMDVLIEGGRALVKSDAILRALCLLGGPWRVAGMLFLVPRGLRDGVYDAVARNRRWCSG